MRTQLVSLFYTILHRRDKVIVQSNDRSLFMTFVFLSFVLFYYLPVQAGETLKTDSLKIKIPADSIFVLKPDSAYSTFNKPLQFSSFIQIKVHGLTRLQQSAVHKGKPIILFLDGIPMKGITSVGGDKKNDVLFFVLHRDSTSMTQWNLLRTIIDVQKKKELSVSVGFEGGQAFPTQIIMAAELSRAGDYFLALLSGTFFIIIFTFLVKRSNVLIDGKDTVSGKYSLAKILFAMWILLILFYLVFILSSTNSLPYLPNSIFIMIAFSALTSFGIKIYHLLCPVSNQNPPSIKEMSKGFLIDMLTTNNGLNLFKIQLLFFNLFIMAHTTIIVISEMMLPAFDLRFIILIGFSYILYLGSLPFDKNS